MREGIQYKSKAFSIQMKIRAFDAFAASVFLYNSELGTVTITIEKHKSTPFNEECYGKQSMYEWPKKISSEDLYSRPKAEPWSRIIKRRRLNWLGHLMRLPKETPARQALEEALHPTKKKEGRPQMAWLIVIEKDVEPVVTLELNTDSMENITSKLERVTQDRKELSKHNKNMERNL